MTNDITWDIRFGLPNPTYCKYISRTLLAGTKLQTVDPFTLEVPDEKLKLAYVERAGLDERICPHPYKIVLGKSGGGKTTFARRHSLELLLKKNLVVDFVLPRLDLGDESIEEELNEGKISLLKPSLLANYIFCAYWERFLFSDFNTYYRNETRRNEIWMRQLRWFYHHYKPFYKQIPGEFELMAWLQSTPDNLYISTSPVTILRELIKFITTPPASQATVYEEATEWLYHNIHISIDGTERLSNSALSRLLHDFEKIKDLHIANLTANLLLHETWKKATFELDSIKKDKIPVYSLPEWNKQDLRRLLTMRLTTWHTNEHFENDKDTETWNWAQLIPNKDLHPVAKLHLIDKIVNGALEISEKHVMDAPIHVLKLARGLVAACAGCWPQYERPLTTKTIDTIIELYRQSVLEEKK